MNSVVETKVEIVTVEWVQNSFMQYRFHIQIIIDNNIKWDKIIVKRFSQFIQLQNDMLKELNLKKCPFDLPTKKFSIWGSKISDIEDDVIKDRQIQLTKFLYDILNNSFDTKWRDSQSMSQFISLQDNNNWSNLINTMKQQGNKNNIKQHANEDEWLIQFRDCKNELIQCQQSHNINHVMKLRLKINELQNQLSQNKDQTLIISQDELIRRQNLLKMIKEDITDLSLNSTSSTPTGHEPLNLPGEFGIEIAQTTIKKPISNGRRKFGETAHTEGLDNKQLYQDNKLVLQNQDQDLKQLHAMIQRQKALSLEMNTELNQQNEILDGFETDVNRVHGKMNRTDDQARKFNR
ncbi:vacuolar morphogenesis protein 7 [Monosporozyma unispora]|nr:hypothetical protein C6P44_004263 [Kazachstania unispora]